MSVSFKVQTINVSKISFSRKIKVQPCCFTYSVRSMMLQSSNSVDGVSSLVTLKYAMFCKM